MVSQDERLHAVCLSPHRKTYSVKMRDGVPSKRKARQAPGLRRSDRLVHIVRELLRSDLLQEQLIKVGEQRLRRLRQQRLVPGELEVRRILDQPVIELEPLAIWRARQLRLDALHCRYVAQIDKALDLCIVESGGFQEGDAVLGGLRRFGDRIEITRIASGIGGIALASFDGRER